MASTISWPLVVWHNFSNPTTTCVTCSYPNVYAGQRDGHIWVYTMHNTKQLQYKLLLVGHRAPIAALCVIKGGQRANDLTATSDDILVSASEDGEIAQWNASDGRCLGVNAKGFLGVPTDLKLFSQAKDRYIFCSGQSNEINILNATTLEVVRVWGSHPNWVTCADFYDPAAKRSRLVTVTMDGKLDIWDFDVAGQVIFKDRSSENQPRLIKETTSDRVIGLKSCPFYHGLCMVLTRKNAIIFVLRQSAFVPEVTISTEHGTSWSSAEFCKGNKLLIWAQNGKIYEYYIKPPAGVDPGSMPHDENQLYYSVSLMHTYYFDTTEHLVPGRWVTAICQDRSSPIAVTFGNHPDNSTFSVNLLNGDENGETKCRETSLQDIWPQKSICDPQFGSITATIPVSSNHLAIGYENGTICVVPLALALLHMPALSQVMDHRQDVRVFKRAHDGPVTCMIVHESHQHQYLLSGGRDGAVKIWNLVDGKYVVSFTVHALGVKSFIEPAEQNDTRIRGCVVSVAKDNSVALISVDSMTCLFMFPGHAYPLSAIQWRTAEDYLVLGYSDEAAFVWQIAAGSLDRVLHGKESKVILEDDRWPINDLSTATTPKPVNGHKHNATMRSVVSTNQALQTTTHFAHVFIFNIRRLVNDLYARYERIRSHDMSDLAVPPTPQQSTSSTSYDAVVPDIANFRPDKDDPLDHSISEDDASMQAGGIDLKKRLELVSAIMSTSISWNVSQAFEDICCTTLALSRQTRHDAISFGLKGANGYLSLLAPIPEEKDTWKVSQVMTASRLLSVALLAKAIIFITGQEAKASDLIAGYAMALPAVIGESYCFPSLSLLSKYWQDHSARSLFSSAVTGLKEDETMAMIAYWENYLPTSSSPDNHNPHMMARATIVLGIMGCDQPQMLSSGVRKYTALSLALLLSDSDLDDPKTHGTDPSTASVARTLASMELLSQGFSTWESYINVAEVLRTMFVYALDTQPAVSRGANNAIFQIAATNMPLVIGTLTYDTTRAKKTSERIRCLKIIGTFIRKKPILLFGDVHRVVEAVVKTLDPNVPHLRENMLPTATAVLHSLVKSYPFVDFSNSAQKLAVGTLEGACVIYDLRTATRSVVLEGHTGAIAALAFSPDAKYVATSSLQDKTVRVWYSNISLLGVLTSSLSQGLSRHGEGDAQKAYKVFAFALPLVISDPHQQLQQVHFEWTSQRCVKLHIKDLVMSFNV